MINISKSNNKSLFIHGSRWDIWHYDCKLQQLIFISDGKKICNIENRLFYSLTSLDQWGDTHPTFGPIGTRGRRVVNVTRPFTKRSSTHDQPTAREEEMRYI